MGVENRNSWPKDLWPGVKSFYGLAYNNHNTEYTEIYETQSSDKMYEEVVGGAGLGLAPVKPEGVAMQFDSSKQGFTTRFTNVAYALGFIITHEEHKDGQSTKLARQRAKMLARSMRLTKEYVGANVINRGFNSSYAGADGVELFSLLHPNEGGAGGTFQNTLTAAAELSESAIEQALIEMDAWTDARGLPIAIKAKKLIIPGALRFEAQRLMVSPLQSGTANNDINAIKSLNAIPEGYCVNHYLSDSSAWFITTDCPDGMIYFEREADSFDMDNEFTTKNGLYGAYGRYSFGYGDPKGMFGVEGS